MFSWPPRPGNAEPLLDLLPPLRVPGRCRMVGARLAAVRPRHLSAVRKVVDSTALGVQRNSVLCRSQSACVADLCHQAQVELERRAIVAQVSIPLVHAGTRGAAVIGHEAQGLRFASRSSSARHAWTAARVADGDDVSWSSGSAVGLGGDGANWRCGACAQGSGGTVEREGKTGKDAEEAQDLSAKIKTR